jgi:hypothetical protein
MTPVKIHKSLDEECALIRMGEAWRVSTRHWTGWLYRVTVRIDTDSEEEAQREYERWSHWIDDRCT